ncbi:MAG: mismatch-specific DNA-glycosylase [Thermoanaerobacterales bacterium]|nr:mismatch-specific DNA-glycosylase [Thermoanaerobacterales bacterium]
MLPDVLGPNLKLVFCGTAVGNRSAQVGAYYADKRNKFWRILHQVGLTERLLLPHEYRELLKYGIGVSDLVKRRTGVDGTLSINDYGVPAFRAKIAKYQPRIVCFNGKRAAKFFLQHSKTMGCR